MKKLLFFIILSIFFINFFSISIIKAQNTITSGSSSSLYGGTSSCPNIFYTDADGNTKVMNISQYLHDLNISSSGSTNSGLNQSINGNDSSTANITYGDGTSSTISRQQILNQFGNNYASLACPPTIADLQTLFLRLLVVVNTLLGVVMLYVFIKASVIRMTSRGNPDAIKKSMSMIIGAILGVCIVLGAYTTLIFIGTRLLPQNPCWRFSFVDSGRILFFFDQSDIAPVVQTGTNKTATCS